jgi:maltose O-acetyltransferase
LINVLPVSHYFKHLIQKIDLWILKKRGLKIGANTFIGLDVRIDPLFPGLVSIGEECRITSGTIILTHDSSIAAYTGEMPVGRVSIGRNTTVGCGSIILPGVTIGDNVIIGSGSVVTKDIPSDSVAYGNPCKVTDSLENVIKRHLDMYERPTIYYDDAIKRSPDEYFSPGPVKNKILLRIFK